MWLRLAGRLGFEPRLAESESAILPLDDLPSAGMGFNTNKPKLAQPLNQVRNCLIRLARLCWVLLWAAAAALKSTSLRRMLGRGGAGGGATGRTTGATATAATSSAATPVSSIA